MDRRLQLHELLLEVLGSTNVYFQPPPTQQMGYPCIVYHQDNSNTQFAGNRPYRYDKRYQVTVIDRIADSAIPDRVAALPKCRFNRWYPANNLHHNVFNLYF